MSLSERLPLRRWKYALQPLDLAQLFRTMASAFFKVSSGFPPSYGHQRGSYTVLCGVTACKYETRDGRGYAVATAANGSLWEYELFEGGDGNEFCSGILERGTILSELWQPVGDGLLASLEA